MELKKRYLPITIFSVASVLALWVSAFCSALDPVAWSWLALSGYAMPVALVMVLVSIVLCVFFRKRLLVIPFVGLVAAYSPVTLYCPFHTEAEVPADAITLVSYNLFNWGLGHDWPPQKELGGTPNNVAKYLGESGADIICLQESNPNPLVQDEVDELLMSRYKYHDTIIYKNGAIVEILSKYEILRKERIEYESNGNVSGAFWLNVKGKEIIVINNHLETMGFSQEDREEFSQMMHGMQEKGEMKATSKNIFSKILEATQKRAVQADAIAAFIRRHASSTMIVCGDFNDIPNSYVHNTIVGAGYLQDGETQDLTDCYKSTGCGPGYSFGKYGMRVRIDNVLCSPDLTPYNCEIDKSISNSDHYPIRCRFTFE